MILRSAFFSVTAHTISARQGQNQLWHHERTSNRTSLANAEMAENTVQHFFRHITIELELELERCLGTNYCFIGPIIACC